MITFFEIYILHAFANLALLFSRPFGFFISADDDYTRASYLGLAPEYAAKMGTHREDVGLASNDWGYGRVVTRVYEAAELFARRLVKLWRDQISFRKRSHNKQDLEYKEDWHWAYKREEVETVWFPLEAFVDHYYEAGEDDRG